MNIFVAGASGAIGRPLIAELIRQGHTVTGLTHSAAGAQRLSELGASVTRASAFDEAAVEQAVRQSHAEVVIDQLTSLPADPAKIIESLPGDRRLRIEGGGALLRAASVNGVRRYIQQSSGFFLRSDSGLADETAGFVTDATPGVALSARTYAELEARLAATTDIEGVALRYGFFYGPNTWYCREGASADQARRGELAINGASDAVWSWIHIEDAALATVAALTIPPGVYNIVDDDPSPVHRWLPAFASFVGAQPPPRLTEEEARQVAGEDAVYYATKLHGASNERAKQTFGFRPRPLEWLA